MRHYYRCIDCLSVVATEAAIQPVQVPPSYVRSYGTCDACEGRIEYLGRVQGENLQKTEWRVPCDSRCTNALGPNCDCQCGGINHGSHRVVEVVIETGNVPRVMIPPDARTKAETYRILYASVREAHSTRYGRVIDLKREGRYLNVADWMLFQEGVRIGSRILAARELRTHSARNKKLDAIFNEILNACVGVCA